jgi:hypothetical protein
VDDRASALRIAEQPDQVGHPVQGKINGVFGPAGEDLLLDLAHPNLDIHRSSLLGAPSRPARTAGYGRLTVRQFQNASGYRLVVQAREREPVADQRCISASRAGSLAERV